MLTKYSSVLRASLAWGARGLGWVMSMAALERFARDAGIPVILAQREADPVVGQHQAAQVRMVLKDNAEHLKGLALEPVAAGPEVAHCRDFGVLPLELAFHDDLLV